MIKITWNPVQQPCTFPADPPPSHLAVAAEERQEGRLYGYTWKNINLHCLQLLNYRRENADDVEQVKGMSEGNG